MLQRLYIRSSLITPRKIEGEYFFKIHPQNFQSYFTQNEKLIDVQGQRSTVEVRRRQLVFSSSSEQFLLTLEGACCFFYVYSSQSYHSRHLLLYFGLKTQGVVFSHSRHQIKLFFYCFYPLGNSGVFYTFYDNFLNYSDLCRPNAQAGVLCICLKTKQRQKANIMSLESLSQQKRGMFILQYFTLMLPNHLYYFPGMPYYGHPPLTWPSYQPPNPSEDIGEKPVKVEEDESIYRDSNPQNEDSEEWVPLQTRNEPSANQQRKNKPRRGRVAKVSFKKIQIDSDDYAYKPQKRGRNLPSNICKQFYVWLFAHPSLQQELHLSVNQKDLDQIRTKCAQDSPERRDYLKPKVLFLRGCAQSLTQEQSLLFRILFFRFLKLYIPVQMSTNFRLNIKGKRQYLKAARKLAKTFKKFYDKNKPRVKLQANDP